MALLEPHHERSRLTARRLCRSNADGDDLFQEAVLRAMDRLGELREEGSFRAWFYAILLSVHRARYRRSFWRRLLPFDDADAAWEPSHPGEADLIDGADRMAAALATLSPEGREAIVLYELEGLSLEEVATLQQASLSSVKSRLARARARLVRFYSHARRATVPITPHPSARSRHELG